MTNILIIGDGAIGLLMSHFLSKENTVHVLTRKPTCNTRFYSRKNAPSHKISARFINLGELAQQPSYDIVIFTVKAFQVQDAFKQVKPYLAENSTLVISHNGMGNIEELMPQLHTQQALYFLTTSMAGFKSNPYIVQHTGEGQSVIGGCNNLAVKNPQFISPLLQAIPNLKVVNNIEQLRFEKLLVNVAINPLTALHNIKNGQLRAPIFSATIMSLLYEGCRVANAQGSNIALADALNNAYTVMALTAENYSSMQQDIANNRPTEIMAICGYISEQGKRYDINTPTNNELLAKIQAKKSVV
jgi:2-dehydropantoate 2-reductase